MNDFSRGYNHYIQGYDFTEYETRDWQRGWLAAERDSLTWWYMQVETDKEIAMFKDKHYGQI